MNKIFFLLAAAWGLALWSCSEKQEYILPSDVPVIVVGATDTSDTPSDSLIRRVVVEELTGVRCPNCPEGTATLVGLGDQYGEQLIVVSIHAAVGYDQPYAESKYDFRTADGTSMANFIGAAQGFPSAAVNRRIVPPETEAYLPRTAWAGIIGEELVEVPQIDIKLKNTYTGASRKLDIDVDLIPTVDLSGEHRLTVLITQDSIVDYQKVNLEKVPNYVHRHVMRDILTQPTGDIISEALVQDVVVKKNFSINLPAGWDEKHCSVVAFVHHGTTPDKEVLQAAEAHVIQ